MESKFIIITTYGPHVDNKEDIRYHLHQVYKETISKIQYENFEVFLFGHLQSSRQGKFNYIHTAGDTKEKKLEEAKNYFLSNNIRSDYVLRLDDDDIINPLIFREVDKLGCDALYDEFHAYYEISSGTVSQQKCPFVPNTCIMKYDLAFARLYLDNCLLFNFQHTVWINYFKRTGAKIVSAGLDNPVYLRILSPSSITSLHGQNKLSDKQEAYRKYLASFGDWRLPDLKQFEQEISSLKSFWVARQGRLEKYRFPKSIEQRIKKFLIGR